MRRHPDARTAQLLGLFAVVGAVPLAGASLLVGPFAWWLGRRVLRDIQYSGGRWSGDGTALSGMVLGIVGTVLLGIALLLGVALAIWAVSAVDPVPPAGGTPV